MITVEVWDLWPLGLSSAHPNLRGDSILPKRKETMTCFSVGGEARNWLRAWDKCVCAVLIRRSLLLWAITPEAFPSTRPDRPPVHQNSLAPAACLEVRDSVSLHGGAKNRRGTDGICYQSMDQWNDRSRRCVRVIWSSNKEPRLNFKKAQWKAREEQSIFWMVVEEVASTKRCHPG